MLSPPRHGSSASLGLAPPPRANSLNASNNSNANAGGGSSVLGTSVGSTGSAQHGWADFDDDDGWQDMPVVRSDDFTSELDAIDDKRFGYRAPLRLDDGTGGPAIGNATGVHLELEDDMVAAAGDSWREKAGVDESEYTRLRLDEDEESEEVHMRTRYLFNEDKAMTPLSQMQATKELLTEGQRIAYVGLCALVARNMLKDMARGWEGIKIKNKTKGRPAEIPCVESGNIWMIKIMARLFQHMELNRDEQHMIDSLAEHGVDPHDLVPALMTTHTVKNPEFDPEAKRKADQEAEEEAVRKAAEAKEEEARAAKEALEAEQRDLESILDPSPPYEETQSQGPPSAHLTPTQPRLPSFDDDGGDIGATRLSISMDDDGDIGSANLSPNPNKSPTKSLSSKSLPPSPPPKDGTAADDAPDKTPRGTAAALPETTEQPLSQEAQPMPALPGVSTSITAADEDVTLDIRWTVLCDLFLVLIADSVYDARSRAFLERVAKGLGFGWLDVVRFENRVTDALEIQESVGQLQQDEVIDNRAKIARRKRYAMMGAAAVGGALVIGLSAGLLAPVIGAGLGAAFTTIGITGTTGFLAGAGGAAVITTGGVLTGANIAGRGMARRTRQVRTFELKPLHNNKRVSCYITVGGFMASINDDVRLPFSVMDSIVGDVFSVLWEPEMMSEMGSAISILGTEVLTQVGQQILQATVMTALMSALQWPLILTKLGYLIDNPWMNALDRAKAAGLVLADVLINRHAGVRPTSLIGFSLGARVIFYALCELARLKAYGIVQDVYLFGATVTASRATWVEARSVVSGRLVNGYASNDWILGYLFRATTAGVNTVAGLRPVDNVHGIENVDVTDCIQGHMSYRSAMPLLLQKVGFPVTADYFDEPDDPDLDPNVQERYIVLDEEEEERRKQKKILGIFPRKKKSKGSGPSTPTTGRASGDTISRTSTPVPGKNTSGEYDDDDLPPREEPAVAGKTALRQSEDGGMDIGDIGTAPERPSTASEEAAAAEEAALRAIPANAGFDFAAISKELGKDLDLNKLRDHSPASPRAMPVVPMSPPNRTESAPPPLPLTPPPRSSSISSPPPPPQRSASVVISPPDDEDTDGDIAATAQRALALDLPAWGEGWGNPSPAPALDRAPSPVASSPAPKSWGFNAWSTPKETAPTGSFNADGIRAAPPARPHPAEFTNPFANAWGDKEKMAMENPW